MSASSYWHFEEECGLSYAWFEFAVVNAEHSKDICLERFCSSSRVFPWLSSSLASSFSQLLSKLFAASKNSFSTSLKNVGRSGTLGRRSKSPKSVDLIKLSTSKKTGSKLLKLFHNWSPWHFPLWWSPKINYNVQGYFINANIEFCDVVFSLRFSRNCFTWA